MKTRLPALLCAASFALQARGEEASFTHDLLAGGDLSAFALHQCEAAFEGGALVLKTGNGLVHTLHRHGDFVLELEWRARKAAKYDSGIYVRSELPAKGKPWPDRYQINLSEGDEGRLVGTEVRAPRDLIRKGDWNRFVIAARGKGKRPVMCISTPAAGSRESRSHEKTRCDPQTAPEPGRDPGPPRRVRAVRPYAAGLR